MSFYSDEKVAIYGKMFCYDYEGSEILAFYYITKEMKKIGLLSTLLLGSIAFIGLYGNSINAEEVKSDVFKPYYSEEFQKAYDFAYMNRITTIDSIDKANMNGYITRAEMAKMISNYAKNILGRTPDTTKTCLFLNSNVSADLVQYMTESCQLGLMGQGISDFRPNDYVTRAEFGTVLSRMLYGTPDGEDIYYSSHLYRLKARGIITNDDPNLQEVRGYVMLMLMRSNSLNEAEYLSCGEFYYPICGEDGKVYSNGCFLNAAGVKPGYNFGVTENNTCEELTNKTIQGKYFLVGINDLHEINYDGYDSYISLNINDKDIYATFCNSISAPDYSISGNTISVKEQIQTEMACEWKLLMDAEKEFILNGAQIYLQPDYLTINTTKGASFKFQKVADSVEMQEVGADNMYYNSGYGISFKLGSEYSGAFIKEWDSEEYNTTTEKIYNMHRIEASKGNQQIFVINAVRNEEFDILDEYKDTVLGSNNKYTFYSANELRNKIIELNIFDVLLI